MLVRSLSAISALCAVLGGAASVCAQTLDPNDIQFFEQQVRPLLVTHCESCHSEAAGQRKGGLWLDRREGWMGVGGAEPVVRPGDPERSRLIRAVRYEDLDLQMPPSGRLPTEAIRALEEWVRRGAPDPRDGAASGIQSRIDWDRGRQHWAFRPLRPALIPERTAASDSPHAIDRFVRQRLAENGLRPAPEASRRDLIRRLTFDLWGLPPSEEEVSAFVEDPEPDAYARVVERLLASPHYGERQARAWLDLARYADSNGLDENLALSQAFHYRDWVVRAFHEDLPYDRFLTAQIAGDLLPESPNRRVTFDQITATGFLVLGPKMLAEQDKAKLVIDTVDEQIDVLTQAAMALTVSCARCHDHKFDPVSQEDYYALAGILKSTSTFGELGFVSRWRERPLATQEMRAEAEANAAERRGIEAELQRVRAEAKTQGERRVLEQFPDYVRAAWEAARQGTTLLAANVHSTNLRLDREQWGSEDVPILHSNGAGRQYAEWRVVLPAGSYRLSVRYAALESRPMRLTIDGKDHGMALTATTGGWHPAQQASFEVASFSGTGATTVIRFERDGAVPHLSELGIDRLDVAPSPSASAGSQELDRRTVLRLARRLTQIDPSEVSFIEGLRTIDGPESDFPARLAGAARSVRDRGDPHAEEVLSVLLSSDARDASALLDRYRVTLRLAHGIPSPAKTAPVANVEGPSERGDLLALAQRFLRGAHGLFERPDEEWVPLARAEVRDRERELSRRLADVKRRQPPTFETVLAVQDGEVVNIPVHIRGNHLDLRAEPVPRGFPTVLRAGAMPPAPEKSSGRRELARWLTDPAHPLTARVFVNRVWQGHFGRGLVTTPSNFGLRGQPPTHPELLDWLALEFIRSGYSVKDLHRTIVHSSTYRMSTRFDAEAQRIDPEERWIWRQRRRRLEAEAVRDALLAVGGSLDRSVGGSLLGTKNGEYVTNDQSNDRARYDTPRRSLYLPLIRNSLYDVFTLFDYNDPSVPVGQRAATVVPSQSLFLLNAPLVREQSRNIARSLPSADPTGAVDGAFRRVFSRSPTPAEAARAMRFLDAVRAHLDASTQPAQDAQVEPLRALIQSLLATNEFLYIE